MTVSLLTHLSFYLPEAIAILTMCGLLFVEAAYGMAERGRTLVYITGIIGMVLCLALLGSNVGIAPISLFAKSVVIDSFGTSMKIIMVLGTLGTFFISDKSTDIYENLKSEYLIMATGVLVGGMLLVSATNLLTLYLGIETLSILSYVMTSLKRKESTSQEAGIKYALYGGVTAGIMLFGMSHLYGLFGSINFADIAVGVKTLEGAKFTAALVSFLLFFVGVGYKIACFPFHMWSPDVYQGSPVPVTAFFSIVPKLAGIAVVTRVTMTFFSAESALGDVWSIFLQVIAALTMTVGNLAALRQESVKRMLAYSSIGHVGMILMGVIVMNQTGTNAILFYGLVYMFMTLAAFFITGFVVNRYGSDDHVFFRGLVKNYPFLTICFVLVLFSLAGLPPFGGFVAKFNMISAAINSKLYSLSFIAAINSVISLYFYIRLAKTMTLDQPDEETEELVEYTVPARIYLAALTIPVVVLGIFWDKIYKVYSAATIALGG